jgi:RND family efflux transporter MFP subunit
MRPPETIFTRICLATVAASLACAFSACSQAKSEAKALTPVRISAVQTVVTGNEQRYSATIVPYSQVDLSFKSAGYIQSIRQVRDSNGRSRNIDQGDFAPRGTVLAEVQTQDYDDKLQQAKAQADRAQADYDHAKLTFDRTSALYSAQSATKPDYDAAKSQFDSATAAINGAKAAISEAQTALNYCTVRAPFDGWILRRTVDIGSLVGPATNGFTIADTRSVKAVFGVPDTVISRIKTGERQIVTTDALSGEFQGRITSVSPAADPKSRVYSVEVTIPNPQDKLKSGMIASLALGGGQLSREVVAIPLEAVVRDTQQPNAFAVLVAEGSGDTVTVKARPVELGEPYGNVIAVTSGLRPGEQIVTTGATLVKSGDQVRVIP